MKLAYTFKLKDSSEFKGVRQIMEIAETQSEVMTRIIERGYSVSDILKVKTSKLKDTRMSSYVDVMIKRDKIEFFGPAFKQRVSIFTTK